MVVTQERKLNVCIIGAGVGGICAAVQLEKQLDHKTITVFESQSDVGGVWLSNRYPGCANDSASFLYAYSFAPKPDWSRSFATNDDIGNYLKDVSKKNGIYKNIKFNTEVKSLIWDENRKKWKTTVATGNSETQCEFDIVISATGHFRNPIYPEEFLNFKGSLVHTAEWNSSVELKNKAVAVIGSGASAIQIIPNIVNDVKSLYSYQRKPIWNFGFFRPDFKIPRPVQWILAYVPFVYWMLVGFLFFIYEMMIVFMYNTKWTVGEKAQNLIIKFLKRQIPNDKKLVEDLIPQYRVGCKRIGLHYDYYKTMARSHVKLFRDPIAKVTNNSIITQDGTETKIDVLILATGYDVQSYFAPMVIIGKNKENILKTWKDDRPSTYFGVTSHSMPNLFFINAPSSDSGGIATTIMVEMHVKLVLRIIKEMVKRKKNCVSVNPSAEKKFMKDLNYWFKDKIQNEDSCGSYYKNSRNETTTIWPLSATSYWLKTRFPNFSNFEFS